MARIAFILLCHKNPDAVIAQAEGLVAAGDCVSIHYDARAPRAEYARIRAALADTEGVTFAAQRLKCGWGEWSLVAATLAALRAAVAAFPDATHFYMLSGDCMAIKPARYAHDFLDRENADFIESFDFFESDWIKTGMREERLIYRHWVNERERKWLFYRSFWAQRALGLKRAIPPGIRIMIGSQWWCLRRETVEKVLRFVGQNRRLVRFFRTTWIPDETFFQTMVRHLVPGNEIRNRTLTFKLFTDYGMPVAFYNDHYDLLLGQDALFARKISPEATELRARLGALYMATDTEVRLTDEGARLYGFLTSRGREGRRFAPRFWEAEASLGRGQELFLVTCKKWHVARRLAEWVRDAGIMPTHGYVFDEDNADLPDLGGIERSLSKRHRHRRALVHLLFEHHQGRKLLICLDPDRVEMMQDFDAAQALVRVLELQCEIDDAFLEGHLMRTGLARPETPRDVLTPLMQTMRADIIHESDMLADAGISAFFRVREGGEAGENALSLARFLAIREGEARALLERGDLFAD